MPPPGKNSPRFFWNNYVDLCSFAENLKVYSTEESIKEKAVALVAALRPGRRKAVLYHSHLGEKVSGTHGLSIYFPLSWVNPKYRDLDFYKDCAWGKFLEKYLGYPQRR